MYDTNIVQQPLRLLTPGPTRLSGQVRRVMSEESLYFGKYTDYFECYETCCNSIQHYFYCKKQVILLPFSATIATEAMFSSCMTKKDSVLCISNGFFGDQMYEIARIYANAERVIFPPLQVITAEVVEGILLKKNNRFDYLTLVHGETTSGMKNDIVGVAKICREYGIRLIVDIVSTAFAEKINLQDLNTFVAIGGSQKSLSAPAGYSFLILDDLAMEKREKSKLSYALDIHEWNRLEKQKDVVCSPSAHIFYAVCEAVKTLASPDERYNMHKVCADFTVQFVQELGLSLYLPKGKSIITVTAIQLPKGVSVDKVICKVRESTGILLAGSFGNVPRNLIRIGHMGENCVLEDIQNALQVIKQEVNEV